MLFAYIFMRGMIGVRQVEFVPNLQYFVEFGTNSFGVFKLKTYLCRQIL